MRWLASLLSKLLPGLVVDATSRLVQAARESLKPPPPTDYPGTRPQLKRPDPPPPIGESGAREASAYLAGATNVQWKRHMDERNAGSAERLAQAAADEPVEAEQPVDDDSAGGKP